jgi:alkylation response protein AidB-like acyl-CoA dehydrogenase
MPFKGFKMLLGRELGKQDYVDWQRKLNARGWAVPHWPAAYGGKGWGPMQEFILMDELQQAPAPTALPFNVSMVGPVIATFGSEAQKKHYLPRAPIWMIWWCQGFSEPGAGSDLASLKTTAGARAISTSSTAKRPGPRWRNMPTGSSCLARTNPQAAKKQQGISFILVDMKTPGITVRPIQPSMAARGERGVLRRRESAGRKFGRPGKPWLGLRQIPARQ